jgi:hypothetical protein
MLQTSAFLPQVLPHATTCPAFIAEQNIRMAAIDFCTRTTLWRETITQAMATQTDAVDVPGYARIVKIISVAVDEAKLLKARASHIDPGTIPGGTPTHYYQIAPGQVSLTPFEACEIETVVALTPRSGQEFGRDPEDTMQDYYNQVPDFLFIDHAELIADGALARTLSMPKRKFTNLRAAADHATRFEAGVARLSAYGIQSQTRAPLRTQPSWL